MSFLDKLLPKILPDDWVAPEEIPQTPESEPVKQTQVPQPQQKTISLSQQKQTYEPTPQPVVQIVPQVAYGAGSSSFNAISPVPDPEYLTFIDSFFEKKNLPGVEYFEYRNAVREMVATGSPVEAAFRTIYIAYKSMGTTKDKLIETNQYYQGEFNKLKVDFIAEAEGIITAKKAEHDKTTAVINTAQGNLDKEEEKLQARLKQIAIERKTNEDNLQLVKDDLAGVTNAQELRKGKMSIAIDYVVGIVAEDEKAIRTLLN